MNEIPLGRHLWIDGDRYVNTTRCHELHAVDCLAVLMPNVDRFCRTCSHYLDGSAVFDGGIVVVRQSNERKTKRREAKKK